VEKSHEIVKFEDQEVKVHRRPKLDLKAWRRHHSQPLGSSNFSSYQRFRSFFMFFYRNGLL